MKKQDDVFELFEEDAPLHEQDNQPPKAEEPDVWRLMGESPPKTSRGEMPAEKQVIQPPIEQDTLDLFDGQAQKQIPDVWDLLGEQEGRNSAPDIWDLAGEKQPPKPLVQPKVVKRPPKSGPTQPQKAKKQRPAKAIKAANATPKSPTGNEQEPPKRKRHILRWVLGSAATLFAVLFIATAIMLLRTTRNDDLWLDLTQVPYRSATVLYATNAQTGQVEEYARLNSTQNMAYVSSGDIPQNLKNAFVAVEDKDFYNHNGVSLRRTLFAVLNEFKYELTGSYIGGDAGRKQGASTIDQQLIKNLTLDDENSNLAGYLRKIREIYRAYKLDNTYDKDTILTAYLNVIGFTGNTAGVQAEAQKLFGKPVSQLTLAECASIASITRNPARYNPVTKPEEHLTRRNYVLGLMLEQGMITADEHANAVAEPLQLAYKGEPDLTQPVTDYFTDVVIDQAIKEFTAQRGITRAEASNLLYNGGLRIYTTVVPALQQTMQKTLGPYNSYPQPGVTVQKAQFNSDGTPKLDENGNPITLPETVYPQAAMVSLNYNGGICAVVGGLGEKEVSRGFNRATSAVRQVGSTMKPIGPYAVALEKNKITWSTPLLDAPVRTVKDPATGEEKEWPVNATNSYAQKDVLVKDAFAKSINTVAVRVGDLAGNRNMYNFVHGKLEVSSLTKADVDSGPLVLGSSTYGITPIEMARAYTIFGNGGELPTVHSFTNINSGTGIVWLEVKVTQKQVLSEETAYIVNRLMAEVMKSGGTASGMAVPGDIESIGKTGTTSDHRDHWFIGLTPYYVTASWYGYDENLPLGADSHWSPPVVAWRTVMQKGQAGLPPAGFAGPVTVVQTPYCTVSGYAAGGNCPAATGYYKQNNLPKANCPVHN
ncbi:transglycosylase domain-containing protein [Ruminococcaceae bacterium OttesenSCG-928-A16]|nr:transglycosylase domain-containing protein [Ruminococcaceae bacterium OttesenSCG-928-A16]